MVAIYRRAIFTSADCAVRAFGALNAVNFIRLADWAVITFANTADGSETILALMILSGDASHGCAILSSASCAALLFGIAYSAAFVTFWASRAVNTSARDASGSVAGGTG